MKNIIKTTTINGRDQYVVNGDCFIIPNELVNAELDNLRETDPEVRLHYLQGIFKLQREFSANCSTFVELWQKSLDYDNVVCHAGIGSNYFPISVFDGKKEGDVIEVDYHSEEGYDIHYVLTLRQSEYRYGPEKFETKLAILKDCLAARLKLAREKAREKSCC